MNFNKFYFIILSVFIATNSVSSQPFSETQRIVKSYKIQNNATLAINNKFGKIQIISNQTDSIKIEIIKTVTAKTKERFDKINSSISFDFTATQFYITAKTIIGNKYPNIINEVKNITNEIISSSNEVLIDYTVLVPNYINLRMENKFGDVYIDDIKGSLLLNLSNGDFKANSIGGSTTINLQFGDGIINTISTAQVNSSFSEFEIKQATNLTIDSKSSKVTIGDVGSVKTISKNDKYYISEINHFYGEASFSNISIEQLNNDINFNIRFGNLTCNSISKIFSFVNIISKFSDMSLFMQSDASYSLDITHKNTKLNYPQKNSQVVQRNIGDDTKLFLTYGTIGNATAQSIIKINSENSTINIIQH